MKIVDLMRGFVMILMVLDHARDFFGFTSFDTTDLARTTPALFFTRWITHFCAPVFVFLAGVSVALAAMRGKSRRRVSRDLLRRGVILIVLEFTLVRVAWFVGLGADLTYRYAMVQVIWAIGWSMIVLAGLVYVPRRLMFALSAAMVVGHHAFDRVDAGSLGSFSGLWKILHVQGPMKWDGDHILLVQYPLVPWPAVIALGYLFAPVLVKSDASCRRTCAMLGAGMIAAFLVLRRVNGYGDPHPWSTQQTWLGTVMSFVNVTKYPASLCYLLMTLGPAIALLPMLGRLPGAVQRVLEVFGRVPFFFYVAHLFLLQFGGAVFAFVRYGDEVFRWSGMPPADYYIGLAPVYGAWVACVVLLYRPCRWYWGRKSKAPQLPL